MKLHRNLFGFLLLATLIVFQSCGQRAHKKELSDKLKLQIERINNETTLLQEGLILNPELIKELYATEKDIIVGKWGNKKKVEQMVTAIRNLSHEGLNPYDYHLENIEILVDRIFVTEVASLDEVVSLELLLTDAYLLMAAHLAGGKTHAETIDPQWRASRRVVNFDLESFVDSTIKNDNVLESLQNISPRHREYKNLKKALLNYREFETNGGWETFSTSLPKLQKGTTHPDVVTLRKRLMVTQGDVYGETEDEELFDQLLHEQVVLFQNRNGLTPDGVVAKATIEALNISVTDRIAIIEANLERWRWLSDDLGERYIKVNIANFELQVIENDIPVFYSEAIVGRPFRKTPVFSSKMTYLVFAPTWTVPPTILRQDVIPAVRKNPNYLAQKNMKVLRNDGSEVNPSTIDWKNVATTGFPYRIRQEPGKDNALRAVKFMFPNQYNVYIHDTPTRELFAQTERSFSSGCIRIKKPMELAQYLLHDKPEWTPEQMKKVVDQGKERTVTLSNPIQVHLLYLTAWAEDDGTVHFRKDIYDRDKQLIEALKQPSPAKAPDLIL